MDARASKQAHCAARVQVASHHGTYVQVDQLMHAGSGISPLPLKTVVKLMWFQVP